ncbi:MAG TPA: NAD(P)H-dependent oxidoreductase [Candidatus Nitrosotenuis sp.]|jgi:NAD(P)H-dependent FMN reductase|nr:NAD(P)H-dependent oxidoreductase [Candidatus Nitrosotenuis sp.]HIH68192.1 NAD(P)H-dependent oxidoreductase [Candidatus Nitrosotenuis sp.]HII04212.1 NAD(P)H-dependent oxidoreductase [Candidatus Nitrosotenuis sp.]
MKVVVISGSPRKQAVTQIMMKFVYDYTKSKNSETTFINLSEGGIDYYKGYDIVYSQTTVNAAKEITDADVWLIGTPIYNSFFSAALKNLFEFVNYKQTSGKTAGLAILASGQIGFTDVQTLLTQLMSYFGVVTNPKAVYLTTNQIVDNLIDENGKCRLKEMVDETLVIASRQK